MKRGQEKEFCEAITSRLHWYEELMEILHKNPHASLTTRGCNVCDAFDDECTLCPLDPCATKQRSRMLDALHITKRKNRKSNIRKHYLHLIGKIERAGFVYE